MSAVLKAKLYKEFIIFNYNLKLKFLGIGGLVWVCGLVWVLVSLASWQKAWYTLNKYTFQKYELLLII